MPSLKSSSIFLVCMSHQAPEKACLWDCPETLALYNIDHAPSSQDSVSILRGLNRHSMSLMADFIVAIEKTPIGDRAAFIDRKRKDDAWVEHRAIWMRWFRSFSTRVNFLLDQSLRDNDCLPHQRMRAMIMTSYPTADTCARFIDELAVSLFTEEILSGDQVAPEIGSVLKPLISIALSTRWLRKYKLAIHTLTGEPLKGARKGSKMKTGPNLITMLEEISTSESFCTYSPIILIIYIIRIGRR